MTLQRRSRRNARLPLAVLVAASLITGSLTVALLAPAGAQQTPTDPTDPTVITTSPPTTKPVTPTPTVPTHDNPLTDAPIDPEAPLEPVDPAAPVALLRDPSPHIRVLLADLTLMEARKSVPAAQAAVDAANVELSNRRLELQAAEEQHQAAINSLSGTRNAFTEFAIVSFMYANGGAVPEMGGAGMFEQRKGAQLTGAVLEHKTDMVASANAQVAATDGVILERQRAVDEAQRFVDEQQVVLTATSDVVKAAEAERLEAGIEDVDRLFDPAIDGGRAPDKPEAEQQWTLSLAGQSVFTVEELQAWFRQWKVAPEASVSGDELARLYVEEGNLENIRGDVMLAQSIWETGTFSNDDTHRLNNFAGIGHCDSCPEGFGFATAQDGVRGQAQLLKSYVEVNPVLANPIVNPKLHGPAGCCQTWNELTGVWASAPTYGPLILGLYEDMLEWLVLARASGGV